MSRKPPCHSWSQFLTTGVLTLVLLGTSGCGFIFTKAPPTGHQQMNHFNCTESNAGPVLDLVWAGLNAAGAAIAAGDETVEDRDQVIAVGLGWTLLSGSAAFIGFDKTSECRDAKRQLAQLQMTPRVASERIAPVASITLSPRSATLTPGEEVQLVASARASSGEVVPNRSFTWSSSNDAVASVNASGLVTAHAEGDVAIAARTDSNVGTVVGVAEIVVRTSQ